MRLVGCDNIHIYFGLPRPPFVSVTGARYSWQSAPHGSRQLCQCSSQGPNSSRGGQPDEGPRPPAGRICHLRFACSSSARLSGELFVTLAVCCVRSQRHGTKKSRNWSLHGFQACGPCKVPAHCTRHCSPHVAIGHVDLSLHGPVTRAWWQTYIAPQKGMGMKPAELCNHDMPAQA